MTTSIEIAEKVAEEANEEIEGLDALSAYIEKVLSRVKITLEDIVLRKVFVYCYNLLSLTQIFCLANIELIANFKT